VDEENDAYIPLEQYESMGVAKVDLESIAQLQELTCKAGLILLT